MREVNRPYDNFYLVWNPPNIVKDSASSGVFFRVATEFLENNRGNALVYGCCLTSENRVKHVSVDTSEDLVKLQGSKYVQSSLADVFPEIKIQLKKNIKVLFSGTACQIAGLYAFLDKSYANLFTIEVFCHGVPSPGLFRDYIKTLEHVYGGKVEKFRFRNKSKTDRHGYIISFEINGRIYKRFANEDTFYSAFLKGDSLRPCCYECHFKDINRTGDISIGDSDNQVFHKNEAISLVSVNSEKGSMLFNSLYGKSEIVKAIFDDESKLNKQIIKATVRPKTRDDFYDTLNKNDRKWINQPISLKYKILNRIKYRISTRVKNNIKRKIRNILD